MPIHPGEAVNQRKSPIIPDKELGKVLDNAILTISDGLTDLDDLPLERLAGSRVVDITARLQAQLKRLDKIVDPLKNRIKVQALEESRGLHCTEFTIRGEHYEAIVRKVSKTILDSAAVKEYLGRKLPQYQTNQTQITIAFEVRG